MSNRVLVARLLETLDPAKTLGIQIKNTSWLETAKPVRCHRAEIEKRDRQYHYGRIRYFVERLRAGRPLKPISLDNLCSGRYIYPVPELLDGNHRLIAHLLAGHKTIRANYGGRIDVLRYLQGRRKTKPQD